MERNRLICVRVPLDVLELIDKEAAKCRYMNRSFVINRVLECMMKCTTGGGLFKALNTYDPVGDGIEVTITKKQKLYKS